MVPFGIAPPQSHHGFIEIDGSQGAEAVGRILEAAYTASRRHRIFVWVRHMSLQDVNAVLDPVVARIGPRVVGLEFVPEQDRGRALAAATSASFRVATSEEVGGILRERGLPASGPREGLELLRRHARREGPESRPRAPVPPGIAARPSPSRSKDKAIR